MEGWMNTYTVPNLLAHSPPKEKQTDLMLAPKQNIRNAALWNNAQNSKTKVKIYTCYVLG